MGYWKSKVLPKIEKVFGAEKSDTAEATTKETSKAKEVAVEAGEEKKEEVEPPAPGAAEVVAETAKA